MLLLQLEALLALVALEEKRRYEKGIMHREREKREERGEGEEWERVCSRRSIAEHGTAQHRTRLYGRSSVRHCNISSGKQAGRQTGRQAENSLSLRVESS